MKKIAIVAKTGSKEKNNLKEVKGEVPQYETIAEAIKTLKEDVVLALINRQVKTDALNSLRKPSNASLGRLVGKAPKEAQDKIADILKRYGIAVS